VIIPKGDLGSPSRGIDLSGSVEWRLLKPRSENTISSLVLSLDNLTSGVGSPQTGFEEINGDVLARDFLGTWDPFDTGQLARTNV
jgi:hypothetical protein